MTTPSYDNFTPEEADLTRAHASVDAHGGLTTICPDCTHTWQSSKGHGTLRCPKCACIFRDGKVIRRADKGEPS